MRKIIVLGIAIVLFGSVNGARSDAYTTIADPVKQEDDTTDAKSKGELIHESYQKVTQVACTTCHMPDALKVTMPVHQPLTSFTNCVSCHVSFASWK